MLLRNATALSLRVRLVVGGADDRAVSQICQKPAAMFVYLDGIEVESSAEASVAT